MRLKILEDSKNYTCQVIKLPIIQKVEGLDNLVKVNIQGNDCLIGKDSNPNELYLFFPAECQINNEFLKENNLYRENTLNKDTTKKGFFELNRRVKAIKFRGIISSGFVIPISSLDMKEITAKTFNNLEEGNEFNVIDDIELCKKYYKKVPGVKGFSNPRVKTIDNVIDSKFAPEHVDTEHLLKNVHKLDLNDFVAISYKLHGTSARYFHSPTKKVLNWKEKIAKKLGINVITEEYNFVTASRRCLKSIGLKELPNKNHYFKSGDLWSEVGKEFFEGKLHKGEAVYCEIIGKTYAGEAIQGGYSYGFERPKVYIYRISNINSNGLEIDLSYLQMKKRANDLGLECCPELYYGRLEDFLRLNDIPENESLENKLNIVFYENLLEKPSILDKSIVEEGFCVRKDNYPKPEIFKIKSKLFLLHEGKLADKEEINIEDNA